MSSWDPACSAPEQHVQGAGAAVGRDCGAEREHFGAGTQPSVDMRFHDRQAAPRSESLAVDDSHATSPTPAGVLEKPIERRRGVRHDAPVQIEVRLNPESTSPQPLHLTPAHAAPGEAQYIARSDIRSPLRLGKPPRARRFAPHPVWGTRHPPGPRRGSAVVPHAPHVAGSPAEQRPILVGYLTAFRHGYRSSGRVPIMPRRCPTGPLRTRFAVAGPAPGGDRRPSSTPIRHFHRSWGTIAHRQHPLEARVGTAVSIPCRR